MIDEMQLEKDIKRWHKKHPVNCKRGKHLPVGLMDDDGNIIEVRCQECAVEMTIEDYLAYFGDPDMISIQDRLNQLYVKTYKAKGGE